MEATHTLEQMGFFRMQITRVWVFDTNMRASRWSSWQRVWPSRVTLQLTEVAPPAGTVQPIETEHSFVI